MRTTAFVLLAACAAGSLSAAFPAPNGSQASGTADGVIRLCQHEGEIVAAGAAAAEYRLRPDDEIQFVYRASREPLTGDYQLEVGDVIRVESHIDATLTREVTVQPDGTVDLLYLGPVRVVRQTVSEIAKDLNQRYTKFYKVTDINVARVRTQSRLANLLAATEPQGGSSGGGVCVRMSPTGTVSLPAIGVVPAQGLTLDEIQREVEARYREQFEGVDVTPILVKRAPSHVFVLGAVRRPGRYELAGPTTALQSLALAGGCNANQRHIVVFRRVDDGGLIATRLDVRGALEGASPSLASDAMLCDGDTVVVPKSPVHWCDEALGHLFGSGSTRGASGPYAESGPGGHSWLKE
jgi:polysaccharide export outer membrane protein